MKEALEFLQEKVDETNIPKDHYEWEIAELMDWYADYYHKEQLKLLPIISLPLVELNNRCEIMQDSYEEDGEIENRFYNAALSDIKYWANLKYGDNDS